MNKWVKAFWICLLLIAGNFITEYFLLPKFNFMQMVSDDIFCIEGILLYVWIAT